MHTDDGSYAMSPAWSRLDRRRLLQRAAAGAAGLTGIALAGCSSNNNQGAKATPTASASAAARPAASAAAPTASTPAAAAAAAGSAAAPITPAGAINAAFSDGTALQLWNPLMWVSGFQTMYRDAVGDPLIAMVGEGDKLKYVNALAESVERAPDGLTATFKLRKEAQFHDGTPVTAADVKFSYEFVTTDQAKHARKSEWVKALKGIDTPDQATVVVHLNQPYPLLYSFNVMFPIISKAAFEKAGFDGFEEHPIAAGPFKFVSGTKGQKVTLSAVSPHYRKTPYAKDYNILAVPEEATRVAQVQTGELDIVPISPASKKTVQGVAGARVAVQKGLVPQYLVIMDPYIGKTDSPLNDVRVRKAVSLTVNRKDIVAKLLDGEAELAGSWSNRYVPGYVSLPPDDFNPADAKKLLEAAGFPNGFDVDYYPIPPLAEYNSVLVADWKKIGINANMKVLDGAAWGSVIGGKKTPGIVGHLTGANYVDAAQWGLFTFSNGSVSFNNSPKLDELMPKVVNGTDEQVRAAAWGDVQKMVYDERIYQVLWHENALTAVGKRIKEWTGVPGIGYIVGVEYAKI